MKLIKQINKTKSNVQSTYHKMKANAWITGSALGTSFLLNTASTQAQEIASNTSTIDPFINFVCDWLLKIGGIIALVGGVMFAMGWQREDADGKSRGLLTLMAGLMLAGLSQSVGIFGL